MKRKQKKSFNKIFILLILIIAIIGFYKSGNIDDKISIGQQIVDLGFSENVKENSVLSKAVALA